MRKYFITLIGVIILFLGSVIYKMENTMDMHHFPIPESLNNKSIDRPLYVFLFFSKNDCASCVMEIVEVLNTLPPQFCVGGIAMGDKLQDVQTLKQWAEVSFPLFDKKKFKKFLPCHTPTLYGVAPSGKVIFVLPGITGQRTYLSDFLATLYEKVFPSFER